MSARESIGAWTAALLAAAVCLTLGACDVVLSSSEKSDATTAVAAARDDITQVSVEYIPTSGLGDTLYVRVLTTEPDVDAAWVRDVLAALDGALPSSPDDQITFVVRSVADGTAEGRLLSVGTHSAAVRITDKPQRTLDMTFYRSDLAAAMLGEP